MIVRYRNFNTPKICKVTVLKVRAWPLCFMFLVQLFVKINAGARIKQTNHRKINTVFQRGSTEMCWSRSVHLSTISIDETKQSHFQPIHWLAVQWKNKQTENVQISSAAFSTLLSLSLQADEHILTGIANQRVLQKSDQAMVGVPDQWYGSWPGHLLCRGQSFGNKV